MKSKIADLCFISCIFLFFLHNTYAQSRESFFNPSKVWPDIDGKTIEAHGGGILNYGNTYFWYGENHALGEGNKTGISCYSSTDLLNWKNEGVVLPKEKLPEMFRDKGVCEQPKVIFNSKTGKFIMWMHLEAKQYSEAMAGVACKGMYFVKFSEGTSEKFIKQ